MLVVIIGEEHYVLRGRDVTNLGLLGLVYCETFSWQNKTNEQNTTTTIYTPWPRPSGRKGKEMKGKNN